MLTKHVRPLAAALICLTFVACGGGSATPTPQAGVIITPVVFLPTASPAPTQPGGLATPVPSTTDAQPTSAAPTATAASSAALSGFVYPIPGGCLPSGDQLMPNAPRTYRNGVHEGVDFYGVDNCTAIGQGTSVVAAKAGTVIRADLDYTDITQADLDVYLSNPNTEQALDTFRGRQVWVQHGTGPQGAIVTRYAHLSGIAPGIRLGSQVNAGDLIAFVGESGTPESVTNPGHEYHLHFEIRVGNSFLGAGLPPDQVRALYIAAFGP